MARRNKDRKLTTVKLDPDHYQEFKIKCMQEGFTFQKLASHAIYLFLTDEKFKNKIKSTIPKNLDLDER